MKPKKATRRVAFSFDSREGGIDSSGTAFAALTPKGALRPAASRLNASTGRVYRTIGLSSERPLLLLTETPPPGRRFCLDGGEGGIRTLDTLPYTHFPGVRLRPLGHLSVGAEFSTAAPPS